MTTTSAATSGTASRPSAIERLDLPEATAYIGTSVREAERSLERATAQTGPVLDATYANTHRFPAPDYALAAFTRAASGEGMTYTPYIGDTDVRGAVARNVEQHLGLTATGDSGVILTPGTQGALYIALSAVIEPGDLVVLPDPDYLSTERTLRFLGARVERVNVEFEDAAGRPTLDATRLRELAAQAPKLFIFSHPNNPTGAVYSEETLQLVADLASRHDFWVLADQLYCRLVYDGESYTHIANLDGMAARTITTLGPSKTESLSGYRLGVAVAPLQVLQRMEDVQSVTALRAPAYAQHVLAHWLAEDGDYVADRTAQYQALRDRTVDRLNASPAFSATRSWGTSYIFPKVLARASDHELAIAIKERAGVVVNPGYQFGAGGTGHMRLCIAQDETEWAAALERLITVVESYL